MTTNQPIWEKRENMGASPVAIEAAEKILKHLDSAEPQRRGILVAMFVDAAFRQAGVPEMFEALKQVLADVDAGNLETAEDSRWPEAHAAINKATTPNPHYA